MKEIVKKYWYIMVIVLCVISLFYVSKNDNNNYEIEKFEEEIKEEKSVDEVLVSNYYVDIKGEVVKPGVYEVRANSRIIDVINKAGGLTKNADVSLLNLSKKVIDEMNIKIYSKTEVKAAKENLKKEPEVIEIIKEIEKECICPDNNLVCNDSNKNDILIDEDNLNESISSDKDNSNQTINDDKKDSNTSLININTATKEELMTIPNIGESKADKIIEYRNKDKFEKIEDILNVSGIGESIFEKIKTYIKV